MSTLQGVGAKVAQGWLWRYLVCGLHAGFASDSCFAGCCRNQPMASLPADAVLNGIYLTIRACPAEGLLSPVVIDEARQTFSFQLVK